ncbi:MAG: c-type cytochrome [Acidobacteria bacterium]|nr:c-type cytochrome [Acidobacteriota bacterium]
MHANNQMKSPPAGAQSRSRAWVRATRAGLLLLPLLLLSGCGGGGTSGRSVSDGEAAPALSWAHFDAPAPPQASLELAALGKEVYLNNCASCHGENGQGNGQCAAFLAPRPRDFTRGIFRFKATPTGALPSDQDLFRTVSVGVQGTPMPPWKFILSEEERWAVVNYIKSFSDYFKDEAPGKPVTLGPEPDLTPERVARGKELFQQNCEKCHGPNGYGDGPSAVDMEDSFGNPIRPRNYHKTAEFKRGHTMRDIALTVSTGNDGTPMPSFQDSLQEEQIWDLASFVMSLEDKRLNSGGTPASATRGDELGKPDVVIQIAERQWKYSPDKIEVHQGQKVRIEFQPTDNGLGAGHGLAIDGYDRVSFINGAMVQRPKSLTFVADKPGTFTFYCATQCSTTSLHPHMKGTLIVHPSGS